MADGSKTQLVVSSYGRQSYGAVLNVDFQSKELSPPPLSYHHEENPISSESASLSFHNISYTVNVGLPCRRQEKTVLRNCRFVHLVRKQTTSKSYLTSATIIARFAYVLAAG